MNRRSFLQALSVSALLSIAQTRAPLNWDDDQVAEMEDTETTHEIQPDDHYGYGPGLVITLGIMRGTITKVGPGRTITIRWNRRPNAQQP
jgi:hypothetical protein